jgi:O-6-methylguanine DNA methyltransferase
MSAEPAASHISREEVAHLARLSRIALSSEELDMLATQLDRVRRTFECDTVTGTNRFSDQLQDELANYFNGSRDGFQTPLVTHGSPFQERVWQALREIPYGRTRSYAEQARMIESPNAVRAVARANGDNRIAIVIPCHRVIGADGKLTGYAGGLWRKRWLLRHEGVPLNEGANQLELPFATPGTPAPQTPNKAQTSGF